jgi:hypothetical protein
MAAEQSPTAESLVRQLKDLAERLNKKSVSRTEFTRETGISQYHVFKHFDSWNAMIEAAELEPSGNRRLADDDLFCAMKDAFMAAGRVCSQPQFKRLCRYDIGVYTRRNWGNWAGVLAKFRDWAAIHAPDFPFLAQLTAVRQVAGRRPHRSSSANWLPAVSPGANECSAAPPLIAWPGKGGRQYGPLINFRGLLHAPLNESGVILLFGMLAQELGYLVESLTPGFPDCEAKRRIGASSDVWERVRIEFEYESRSFASHGHRADDCDLIVCWRHTWPQCPLEVLELKSAVEAIGRREG